MIVRVHIAVHHGTTVLIHLSQQWVYGEPGLLSKQNFVIRNLSHEWDATVRQKGLPERFNAMVGRYADDKAAEDADLPFAWDTPPTSKDPGRVLLICNANDDRGRKDIECKLDEPRVVQESGPRVELVAEGATVVLLISDGVGKPMEERLF